MFEELLKGEASWPCEVTLNFRASGHVPSVFFRDQGREALVHKLLVTNGLEAGNMRFFPVSPGNGLYSEE
jgi:hypothetical protein